MTNRLHAVYSKVVGTASLSTQTVVAGSIVNLRLTYTAGECGLDDSGAIKILFRIVTDAGMPQFSDEEAENFLRVSSNNENTIFKFNAPSTGYVGKIGTRPWSKGFIVVLTNTHMAKNDQIFLDFKNWQTQTFCEKEFLFKVLVDAFATGEFIEIANSPKLEILNDKPANLIILAPSVVKPETTFKALIKVIDKWGNPCFDINDGFEITPSDDIKRKPSPTTFKNGVSILKFSSSGGTRFIEAKYGKLAASSNPIIVKGGFTKSYFWADLHGQSEETVGTKTIEEYFNFGKRYGFLDVAGHQGNDFQITNGFWKRINIATKEVTQENEFVAFPGYEWSANTSNGGDRNIYYLDENQKLIRSSHALVDDTSDISRDISIVEKLFKKLDPKETLVIAHVGGRYADLTKHSEEVEKLIEVHSVWGTFEWFMNEAFKNNYKVGIVAGGDGHTGRLGAEFPGISEFTSLGGLTCILAKKLTRESIFSALRKRHCYATTGARIFLDLQIVGKELLMGDELHVKNLEGLKLKVTAVGTDIIDRVEIRNGREVIHNWFPQITKDSPVFKILWMGAKTKGRNRRLEWKGSLEVVGSKIKNNITPINFLNQNNKIEVKNDKVVFNGATSGGTQGLTFHLDKNEGKLKLQLNNKNYEFDVKKIFQKPIFRKVGLLDSGIEISRISTDKLNKVANFTCPITKLGKEFNAINIKVIQQNGHMAWSSPIFITK